MTKEELSQLRHIVKEIELLKKEIEKMENSPEDYIACDVVSGSNPKWPYEPRRFHVEGITLPNYEKRLKKLKKRLQRRIDELMEKREELEEYISTIDDSELRIIFALRYINGLTWREIAAHLGVAGDGSTERKKHDRYLKLSRYSSK